MAAKDLGYYCKKFEKLSVNRQKDRGEAPHKPILLLAILELIAQHKIERNRIELSPELIATFLKYWGHLVTTEHQSTIALPFYHLTGDRFWHLQPNPGYEQIKVTSIKALRQVYAYAYLDAELFTLIQQASAREILVQQLFQRWFPSANVQLENLYSVDAFESQQLRLFDSGGSVYSLEQLKLESEEQAVVRSASFRTGIISLYEHRCALCHLQVVSSRGQFIVDGAHIKPFAKFRDDRLRNGLSLCKNHHWAFDRGWFGIDDNYQLVVPRDRIRETAPAGTQTMQDYHGELILLPSRTDYHPDPEALQWHREYWEIA